MSPGRAAGARRVAAPRAATTSAPAPTAPGVRYTPEHVKRLARRLFTFCSALSLAVCVTVCVLWAASHLYPRTWVNGGHPGVRWEVRSAGGWVTVERHEVLFLP